MNAASGAPDEGEEEDARAIVSPTAAFFRIEDGFEMPSATKQPRESFLSKLLEQVLPGDYGFILRLIKDRDLKKRPSELRNDKVLQPFDDKKFNFTKIAQQEVIFRFEESESCMNNYLGTSSMFDPGSLNIIAINVSPIGHGHVLLLPHILKRSPQKMDREGLLLSLYMSREASSPYFRVIYNSLGAFATINHLHFQVSLRFVMFFEYLLFFACYAERIAVGEVEQEIIDVQVNPAAWEISGFLVLKRREDFVEATEEKVCRFFTRVSLSEERFQEMQESILQALHGADAGPDHEMESQLFQ
ncbi:GDP-L-galactose phosphorylase 1 [Apostasia shenzhenica]|uniref:GDP-L-galactose phosphorylase 1 n=1 Tax=Apostasia shenzhenica TaxID=1088818 RepID=A0A2I0AUD3_9ASPA|nr:GDP-L-galactose phosphorylase 1 [Apostasia shenzhenica]